MEYRSWKMLYDTRIKTIGITRIEYENDIFASLDQPGNRRTYVFNFVRISTSSHCEIVACLWYTCCASLDTIFGEFGKFGEIGESIEILFEINRIGIRVKMRRSHEHNFRESKELMIRSWT